jgi:hypothetical protein
MQVAQHVGEDQLVELCTSFFVDQYELITAEHKAQWLRKVDKPTRMNVRNLHLEVMEAARIQAEQEKALPPVPELQPTKVHWNWRLRGSGNRLVDLGPKAVHGAGPSNAPATSRPQFSRQSTVSNPLQPQGSNKCCLQ